MNQLPMDSLLVLSLGGDCYRAMDNSITMSVNDIKDTFTVHRAICQMFIGKGVSSLAESNTRLIYFADVT